eukprot:scaffold77848_cov65-Phaeocystis_antarctica.AAC.1
MLPFVCTSPELLFPAESVADMSCPGCTNPAANQAAGLSDGLVPVTDGRASPDGPCSAASDARKLPLRRVAPGPAVGATARAAAAGPSSPVGSVASGAGPVASARPGAAGDRGGPRRLACERPPARWRAVAASLAAADACRAAYGACRAAADACQAADDACRAVDGAFRAALRACRAAAPWPAAAPVPRGTSAAAAAASATARTAPATRPYRAARTCTRVHSRPVQSTTPRTAQLLLRSVSTLARRLRHPLRTHVAPGTPRSRGPLQHGPHSMP